MISVNGLKCCSKRISLWIKLNLWLKLFCFVVLLFFSIPCQTRSNGKFDGQLLICYYHQEYFVKYRNYAFLFDCLLRHFFKWIFILVVIDAFLITSDIALDFQQLDRSWSVWKMISDIEIDVIVICLLYCNYLWKLFCESDRLLNLKWETSSDSALNNCTKNLNLWFKLHFTVQLVSIKWWISSFKIVDGGHISSHIYFAHFIVNGYWS